MQSDKGLYWWMASNMQCKIETNDHAYQRWFLYMASYHGKWIIKIVWSEARQAYEDMDLKLGIHCWC